MTARGDDDAAADVDVVAFVRLGCTGHHGQGVSLSWRVIVRELATLHTCLPLLGLPTDLLDELWPVVSTVEVGREGSAVLYVAVPYWTRQRNDHDPAQPSQHLDDPDRHIIAQQLRDLGRTHRADEIGVISGVTRGNPVTDWRGVPADPYKVRLWWD